MPLNPPLPPTRIDIPYLEDSEAYFKQLKPLPFRIWLDSGRTKSDNTRFDILSAAPVKVMESDSLQHIEEHAKALFSDTDVSNQDDCPFPGGVIGYLEYEALHAHYALAGKGTGHWAFFDWAIVQDHNLKHSYAIFHPKWRSSERDQRLDVLLNGECASTVETNHLSPPVKVTPFQKDTTYNDYQRAFEKIKNYILSGDCYQINFAQRFSAKFQGDASEAYRYLRHILPGPYSSFMDFGSHQILSFSPEQFISIKGDNAQTRPIKGTTGRGDDQKEDQRLADDLMQSEKNRSENLMIVDLLRNDFSKNCVPYSVKVPTLFSLESYANVHHLVSTVTGKIRPEVSHAEFISACFPGGSITGAPKKRAMEIIDELEDHARKIYCGSIISMGANGRSESNIAIRTLLVEGENIFCWGGGGIVADSTLAEEYTESIQKVRVLMEALEGANSRLGDVD